MIDSKDIPKPTLNRLPDYLNYLNMKQREGVEYISSTVIAKDLKLNPVQIRKDLAVTGSKGKPKVGFDINDLIRAINKILRYSNTDVAVLVGAGQLGKALLSYDEFSNYGLNILAAFDTAPSVCGAAVKGKKIYEINELEEYIHKTNVIIGIITVPAESAQKICDKLVHAGIRAIWNFAPTHLIVPDDVIVQNENMAASLAILSNKLTIKLSENKKD